MSSAEEAIWEQIAANETRPDVGVKPYDLGKAPDTPPDCRSYNIGASDYAKHKIQPWDIWRDYSLNPWDADIIKRVLRTKETDTRILDYQKIKHICDERISQLQGIYDV